MRDRERERLRENTYALVTRDELLLDLGRHAGDQGSVEVLDCLLQLLAVLCAGVEATVRIAREILAVETQELRPQQLEEDRTLVLVFGDSRALRRRAAGKVDEVEPTVLALVALNVGRAIEGHWLTLLLRVIVHMHLQERQHCWVRWEREQTSHTCAATMCFFMCSIRPICSIILLKVGSLAYTEWPPSALP